MSANFLKTLEEQRDHAREIAASTIGLLANPDFTRDEVSDLYKAAENHALEFKRVVSDLIEHEVDETLLEMAEAIEAMWDTILSAIGRHLVEPQG